MLGEPPEQIHPPGAEFCSDSSAWLREFVGDKKDEDIQAKMQIHNSWERVKEECKISFVDWREQRETTIARDLLL